MLNWIVLNRTDYLHKMDLVWNNLQNWYAIKPYQPIVSMTRKTPAPQIREEIFYSLVCSRLFLEERKGCYKVTRVTGDLMYINHHILKESKGEKSSHGANRQQKWYCPAILESRQSENVKNVQQLNFWNEACWFLSLKFFGLLSSSLLLFLSEDSCFKSYPSRPEVYLVKNVVR